MFLIKEYPIFLLSDSTLSFITKFHSKEAVPAGLLDLSRLLYRADTERVLRNGSQSLLCVVDSISLVTEFLSTCQESPPREPEIIAVSQERGFLLEPWLLGLDLNCPAWSPSLAVLGTTSLCLWGISAPAGSLKALGDVFHVVPSRVHLIWLLDPVPVFFMAPFGFQSLLLSF